MQPDSPVKESSPSEVDDCPREVKIYTLGRFTLMRDGRAVKFTGKAQHKPVEMLKAIISLGGRNVSEMSLSLLLWPDALGDAAHQAFKTTLHRLRHIIGNNAILNQEGRLALDNRHCWVDAWAFERLLNRLEQEGFEMPAWRLFDEVLNMYRGPFLESDDGQWALSMRERLRSKFIRLLSRFGNHFCETHRCEEAMTVYRKGLEVDNLAEEFYRNLIYCLATMDRHAEAAVIYERCRRILVSVLGVEPSVVTRALYDEVRKGMAGAAQLNRERIRS